MFFWGVGGESESLKVEIFRLTHFMPLFQILEVRIHSSNILMPYKPNVIALQYLKVIKLYISKTSCIQISKSTYLPPLYYYFHWSMESGIANIYLIVIKLYSNLICPGPYPRDSKLGQDWYTDPQVQV